MSCVAAKQGVSAHRPLQAAWCQVVFDNVGSPAALLQSCFCAEVPMQSHVCEGRGALIWSVADIHFKTCLTCPGRLLCAVQVALVTGTRAFF